MLITKMKNPAVTPVHPRPKTVKPLATLLLGDTDGPAATTGGLGVLTADAEAPVVSETTVGADLLEALQILTELGVDAVGQDVGVLAVDNVALSVEEPGGDLVLGGVLDDGDDTLELFGGKLTGAAVQKKFLLVFQIPRFFACLMASVVASTTSRIKSQSHRHRSEYSRTACSGRHRPSCRPSWSIGDRHP